MLLILYILLLLLLIFLLAYVYVRDKVDDDNYEDYDDDIIN